MARAAKLTSKERNQKAHTEYLYRLLKDKMERMQSHYESLIYLADEYRNELNYERRKVDRLQRQIIELEKIK